MPELSSSLRPRALFGLLAVTGFLATSTPSDAAPGKVYRDRVEPHWFNANNKFWYRVETGDKRHEFVLVDAVEGTRRAAFDHERLAKAWSDQAQAETKPDQLPFSNLSFADDGKSVLLTKGDERWRCDLESYQLTKEAATEEKKTTPPSPEPRRGRSRDSSGSTNTKSPDGKWEVLVRGHNLSLRENDKERSLTFDGNPNSTYARDVQRDRAIEMEFDTREPEVATPEVYWSPDSKHLVAMRTRPGTQRTVYLVASSPRDQLQPKLQSYPYLKPGDEIPLRHPRLFDVEGMEEIPIDQSLFANPWAITQVRWATNSSHFTFLYNQRGHQCLRLLAVDAETGEAEAVIDEESQTFINYSGYFYFRYIEPSREIIWMSERDGWNHLYLYDAATRRVKKQITKGEWVVRGVDRVDVEKRQIWFRAGGILPEQDPYYIHLCRVNFDGTGLTILTAGNGTHTGQFSPDHRFLVDTYSRVDLAPITELRQTESGALVCALEQADKAALDETGWRPPQQFIAAGRDDTTPIYGVIHWPREVDTTRQYPVIESIYAGPHDAFVPKSFRTSYGLDELTKLGFVVVQIDGMGTANRSKKFHDVCWKNLGDSGFPDRILWIKAAAAKYPHLDASRVGIYGGSAGGQSALRALLAHGDFYKAAAADCGCHDNRMDKIWWNEQWMGWPVGPHYEEQSNVTQAHKLQGKLLLTFGELDKNVDPASTLQVVDALIKADKDFELIIFPGAGHGAGGSPYGRRRRNDFFVRHLMP